MVKPYNNSNHHHQWQFQKQKENFTCYLWMPIVCVYEWFHSHSPLIHHFQFFIYYYKFSSCHFRCEAKMLINYYYFGFYCVCGMRVCLVCRQHNLLKMFLFSKLFGIDLFVEKAIHIYYYNLMESRWERLWKKIGFFFSRSFILSG